jgi:adenylosuccinate lyase
MIPRYECPEISQIWSEENKFQTMLDVELALLETLEEDGIVPRNTAKQIKDKAKISVKRINEIEAVTRHDIIAFCTSITENFDANVGKYFHYGVTSSDIIDTSFNLQIKQSLEKIIPEYEKLLRALKDSSIKYKDLISMGRSHGMFAEPLSFGQKFLYAYAEFARHFRDLKDFYENEITGQLSGAVGNYCILTTAQEARALKKLSLRIEPVSTQVIPRDRNAKLVSTSALIASAIERLCVEIRHLHHSDINELHEGFAKGQKGSSTMPHKKNPISGENLSGMARFLRSHLSIAHENIPLWHERDISHSSTERLYMPDHLGILFYSLRRLTKTIENLVIHEEVVEKKVEQNFTYLSSYFLHHLINHYEGTREDFYAIVQAAAFDSNNSVEFGEKVVQNCKQKGLEVNDLPTLDLAQIKKIYLQETENVFKRTFDLYPIS